MDPQTNSQSLLSPELRPVLPATVGAELPAAATEQQPQPVAREVAPVPAAPTVAAPVVLPVAAPVAALSPQVAAPLPPVVAPVVTPAIAEDVDVIEKEWVDQAQEIVQAHSEDPYQEEEAVENLQVDYLKKRYGVEIKKDQPSK